MGHTGGGYCRIHRQHVPVLLGELSCRGLCYIFGTSVISLSTGTLISSTGSSIHEFVCSDCAPLGISEPVTAKRPNFMVDGGFLGKTVLYVKVFVWKFSWVPQALHQWLYIRIAIMLVL